MSRIHTTASRPSSDKTKLKDLLSKAKNILFLTGAGISAESGIPTFRGAGGLWRTFSATDLATPGAFHTNPSLVWEFYSYRREVVLSKKPNPAHFAIAEFQKKMRNEGKQVWVVTQNIDELHKTAGAEDVIELHGTLFKTRCNHVTTQGSITLGIVLAPDPNAPDAKIPLTELPRCVRPECDALVRPHVVWFGEALDPVVLQQIEKVLGECDFCFIVGTSSVVYPAAGFAPMLAQRGVPVAEFNMEETSCTGQFSFHFQGKAGVTLPPILGIMN
ncbi:predicted protein [Nematostella vectensis]|uniref:NAD-dependent protein deacylase n=1 Tax=Nematostella vectensis TaxID=45351 RepID=A7RMK8_NEMVE|nr:predicted protein [Nematostella vectensis]|eukprot:XP_001639425.1 predicted protein [Nematostella vectensis]